jgi:hypothetical protein
MLLNHYVNEILIENIYVILDVLKVSEYKSVFKKKTSLCFLFVIERTNSCVDTHTLQMANNYSKTGFGYKHRPG